MPSFASLPAEQDVYVVWGVGGPTLPALRAIKLVVPELGDPTVTELYRMTKGKTEFRVGRFRLLRAMELRSLLEERGLTAHLR